MFLKVWNGTKVASLRKVVGRAVVFSSMMLWMNLTLVYAHLGFWLSGITGTASVFFALLSVGASYLMYVVLVMTYFRWRILGLTDTLKDDLREDLVDKCPTREASVYVALFSLFQFSRTNELRWDEFDAVFFGIFPGARITVTQRKVMNELCGLAPAEGTW